jgi:oxygen-dependent protoporphyrinogen oxidase
MLGTIDPKERKVTVVGGGISGLLIAYVLDQKGYEVHLIESQPRFGGVIRTDMTPFGISESAAHSLLVTPEMKAFIEGLGVTLLEVRKGSRARYIIRNGLIKKFPLRLWEAAHAFFRAYFILSHRKLNLEEMSLEEWGHRFLGTAVTRHLLTPMVSVIYGAHPRELNLSAAFPLFAVPPGHSLLSYQLAKWIRRRIGILPKAQKFKMMTPAQGMGELISGLEEKLKVRLGTRLRKAENVNLLPTGGNIVLTVPAYSAAEILKELDPELSQALSQVKYTSIVSVTVFMNRSDLQLCPRGTGMILSEEEETSCLGVLFNSSAFENRVVRDQLSTPSIVSCTVMLGGTKNPSAVDFTDERVFQEVERMLTRTFGLRGNVLEFRIHRWKKAIPLYDSHLKKTWQIARNRWCSRPGMVLFGNYTGKVGLRGLIETVMDLDKNI